MVSHLSKCSCFHPAIWFYGWSVLPSMQLLLSANNILEVKAHSNNVVRCSITTWTIIALDSVPHNKLLDKLCMHITLLEISGCGSELIYPQECSVSQWMVISRAYSLSGLKSKSNPDISWIGWHQFNQDKAGQSQCDQHAQDDPDNQDTQDNLDDATRFQTW